jgi:hypothetical protein
MNRVTAAIVRRGERRISERRATVAPDPLVAVLNLVTADRDRLKAENRRLREAITKAAHVIELGAHHHTGATQ